MSNLSDAKGLCLPYGRTGSQYETLLEPATSTLWGYFKPRGTACFSLGLLKDIRAHDNALAVNGGAVEIEGERYPVRYYVCGSRIPGVFNLGGDLALFVLLIKSRDRDALSHYARMCIDNMHARIQNYYSRDLVTISMVQGDALGGGLECALSSDLVVAEESAQLGLPEILFNLFPGMGACSLLSRRIGLRAAERMILSGKVQPATALHEAGIVDVLAKDGEGENAVREWIARDARRQNGTRAVYRARQLVQPITREELDAVAQLWVDAAMKVQDRDLKMMSRIVRSQMRRLETGEALDITADAVTADALAVAV
jgi:DSF synthase